MILMVLFCFKQKAAYEMRISDWSSDVCSSDLVVLAAHMLRLEKPVGDRHPLLFRSAVDDTQPFLERRGRLADVARVAGERERVEVGAWHTLGMPGPPRRRRQIEGDRRPCHQSVRSELSPVTGSGSIGRAAGRERVCTYVMIPGDAGYIK